MVEDDEALRARHAGFLADQVRLEAKLAEIDIQREDTRKQIEHLKRIVAELGALCGIPSSNNLGTLGFTQACRAVLSKAYPAYISAKEIKDRLEQGGFDLSQYQNPFASIYTILNRLEESNFAEKKTEGWNVLYRWKRKSRLSRIEVARIRRKARESLKGE